MRAKRGLLFVGAVDGDLNDHVAGDPEMVFAVSAESAGGRPSNRGIP
jgi:hypothetical protein